MSRNNGYKNHLDEEDDGEELQLTDQDEAASDDHGRELAAVYIKTARSIRGRNKWDEKHRRMWLRMAIKALAEGRERQKAAEAAEKARVVAEQKAEKERAAQVERTRKNGELLDKSGRESAAMWASVEAANKVAEAEWAAGRADREAAAAMQPVQTRTARTDAGRGALRAPTTIAAMNAVGTRPATKPVTTKPVTAPTLPKLASPSGVTMPGSTQAAGSPAGTRSGEGGPRLRETQPLRQTPQQAPPPWSPPPAQRVEPQRQVATSPQRRAATPPSTSTPAATRTPPSQATPPTTRSPMLTVANQPPRAFVAPPRPVLTGADLAAWRSARGLTQRPAATLLGVAPSTVAKAELLPGKALGEQLQVALAAAMKR